MQLIKKRLLLIVIKRLYMIINNKSAEAVEILWDDYCVYLTILTEDTNTAALCFLIRVKAPQSHTECRSIAMVTKWCPLLHTQH